LFAGGIALATPPEGAGYSYKLVFEDNFDGTTLNSGNWSKGYPWGNGHTHNHDAYCIDSQVAVSGGYLNITAAYSPNYAGTGYNYISGVITSSGKKHFTRGYLEGSFKMAGAIGSWPAFWTLQSGWPPEIDILENPCWSSDVVNTYHFYYHYTGPSGDASFGSTKTGTNLSTTYHTYGCEWTANQMAWYYDNSQNGRWTSSYISQASNMYLLINLAVGGFLLSGPDG